jgi:hypothetical protein
MSDSRASLEETLAQIGRALDFPPEPDVSSAVVARINAGERPGRPARPRVMRLAVAALALGVAATGVLLFSPTARNALASWLGLPGIRITITNKTPSTAPGTTLELGERATLARAEHRLDARVRLPSANHLGPPDAIYVDESRPVVWLVYRPAPGLPAVAKHQVGLLVTELRAGSLDEFFYKKLLSGGAVLKPVSVDGEVGFWIHGQPHLIQTRDAAGLIDQETGRVSGNSLIWAAGGITYRLELDAGLGSALAIAHSMR